MTARSPSIVVGPPLAEEEGLGALTLSGWLAQVCGHYGDAEALVFFDGDTRISWTYARLWDEANAVARALIAAGVGKGARVGILLTNRPEFLAATFGCALAGGVAAAISTFSTADELEYLLAASACSVLFIESHILKKDFAAILRDADAAIVDGMAGAIASTKFPFLTHIVAVGEAGGAIESWNDFIARGESVAQSRVVARAATVVPADHGVLFFSSGSTAKPKGILSAHRGVTLQLWRMAKYYGYHPDHSIRVWSANGFFWSGNFAMAIGGCLSAGGTLVLQSTFQPEEALALLEKEQVSLIHAWPHQWAQLIGAPNWESTDLSALHYVDAQSPLAQHPTIKTTWREPRAAYGNTETFTISSIFPANTPDEVIAGSHGRPCPGNVFKILDPMTGEIVPMGDKGEIAVKGPTMMLQYLGIPADETFDAEGFLRTGDGGWFDDDGRLHWEGRLNDIIKTGGANVSPIEIDTLLKTLPGVKAVQTVGVPDDLLGELAVSCIVPHIGADLNEDAIKAFAKEKLASFKVPRRVLFFDESELELTGSAKIKTSDLRAAATKRLQGEGA
jgi:fatty-acyl-CoA synthase